MNVMREEPRRTPFANFLRSWRRDNPRGPMWIQRAGEAWRSLSAEERAPFVRIAQEARARNLPPLRRSQRMPGCYRGAGDGP